MRALFTGLLLVIVGCQSAQAPEGHSPGAVSVATAKAVAAPRAPAPRGTASYLNLLALSHLADVGDPAGLFVDFGTPARMKYTFGNWNSGWGADVTADGATATLFGKTGRLQVTDHPRVVTVRAKSLGATKLTVYVDGKAIRTFDTKPSDGYQELSVTVPEAGRSPHDIRLRANRLGSFKGKRASFAVDWIRVGLSADPSPSRLDSAPMVQPIAISDVTRDAVVIPAGATLRWYGEIPADGTLVFGAAMASGASGKLSLSVASDAKSGAITVEESVRAVWSDQQISLAPVAGQIAELSFSATSGPVALSDVRIVRRQPKVKPIQKRARNVIVLLIDTLRASKLELYYSKTRVKTPALDAFAAQGALFERPQSPENWTKPAVASLLTSLHPMTHRTKEQGSKLPQKALTLGEVYQREGFKTASFLANGYVSRAFGFDQGWDHYTNYIRERRNTNASNVFGEAIQWIEKHKEQRFFVYIQTIDPHVPYDPPDEFLKMYDPKPYSGQVKNRRTHLMLDDVKKNPKKYKFTARDKERIEALHDGEISYHDEYFGRFLKQLDALGLSEDTIIVVTSDHGEEFQEHGSWGHGHSVYQELLHVPLIMRWPGAIAAGSRITPVVTTMDVAPTVLEASGIAIPKEFEGRSLMGFLRGNWPPAPHVAFSDFMDNRRVIVGGDWKYIIRANLSHVAFDLKNDPWEKKELRSTQDPIASRYLHILLGQYLGAKDRGRWLVGGTQTRKLDSETQQMTPELCRQLVALGYISAECEALIK